jgi:hypothetical protein
MELVYILLGLVALITIIGAYIRYEPKFDLVINKGIHLYLWYTKSDWLDNREREYIKIF